MNSEQSENGKSLASENLEHFITAFCNEQDQCAKAGKLHSFASSFLHSIKEDDIEAKNNFFLSLMTKVPVSFSMLTKVNNGICSIDVENGSNKEKKALNLQAATMYLEAVSFCLAYPKTNEQLLAVVQTSLVVLYDAYTHCKESEPFYADLMEEFTDQLAHFFRKIQDLQAALVGNFDQLFRLEEGEVNNLAIVSISKDLGKLCEIVLILDKVIAASLWRIFAKFISHYIQIVKEEQNVDPILSTLIFSISDIMQDCKFKMENNEEIAESDIKIFLFQLNLVMKIFHAFRGHIKESIQMTVTLSLDLYDLLMLCCTPTINESSLGALKRALINNVCPMVALFYSDSNFFTSAFQSNRKETTRNHLAHLLLQLAALDYMYSTKDSLGHVDRDQYKDIFTRVILIHQLSKPEDDMKLLCIRMPLSLFNTTVSLQNREHKLVTLYELVYRLLSECSRNIPDEDFEKIENQMTNLLLSSSDLMSLFVADVWIYRLRCSSVDFLYTQCAVLSQKFLKSNSSRLEQFIKRTLNFLPQEHKMRLFKENPQLKHLLHKSYKAPQKCGIESLPLFCNKEDTDNYQKISLLMEKLNCSSTDAQLTVKACSILELFSLLIDVAQSSELLKFLEFSHLMFKTGIYDVQVAVLAFLKIFNGKTLPGNDSEFGKISSTFAALLTETLRSKNYMVKYEALETYSSLARSTRHPRIFQLSAPDIIPVIKSYFTKDPSVRLLTEKERFEISQKQLHSFTNHKSSEIISDESRKILSQLRPT